MNVDDILPIVEASVILGFAVCAKATSRSRRKGEPSAKPTFRRQKQLFREAALKNIAILRLIENTLHAKRDHAIGEEFFRDILDEHFSSG